MSSPFTKSAAHTNLLVSLLVVLGLLTGVYYSLRVGGWGMEVDASRQAVSADGILATGRLENARNYNNGYGYSAQMAFVSLVTGIDIQPIQLASGAWVFVIALVAFITFRELLGSAAGGALAAFLLLIQPDFLFYVVRGSHERSTWTCALLMVFFLVRSYRHASVPRKLLVDVLLFYLAFWAMTGCNVYFASTFMVAILLSVPARWIFERLFRQKEAPGETAGGWQNRLLLICLSCLTLIYIFINYTYRPALNYYGMIYSLIDRISILLLGSEPIQELASYSYLVVAWRSQAAYAAVTWFQWLIAVSSVMIWLWATLRFSRLEQKSRLLWQLYTSFGFLLAFSLVADFAGFLSSNLQLRMFTPFTLFSSPMVAFGVLAAWRKLAPQLQRRLVPAAGLVFLFAFLAMQVKITNDPLVANQWIFYSPAEITASSWFDHHIQNQQIWVDTRDHLRKSIYFWEGYNVQHPNDYVYSVGSEFPYVLISQLTQMRANRVGISLPDTSDYYRIYDNGISQLFHQRPATPYQR